MIEGKSKYCPLLPRGPIFSAGSVIYARSVTQPIPSENGEYSVSENCRFCGTHMEGRRVGKPLSVVFDLVDGRGEVEKTVNLSVLEVALWGLGVL